MGSGCGILTAAGAYLVGRSGMAGEAATCMPVCYVALQCTTSLAIEFMASWLLRIRSPATCCVLTCAAPVCHAVGFDVRRVCIQMGRESLRQLVANSPE